MKRLWLLWLWLPSACATTGKAWMQEPFTVRDDDASAPKSLPRDPDLSAPTPPGFAVKSRTLGEKPRETVACTVEAEASEPRPNVTAKGGRSKSGSKPADLPQGKILGTFRNTYYDFPAESDFEGSPVTLYGPTCRPIATTARGFFEALCVQGSGLLASGNVVSFSRRDCECAEICPKTGQKICFDALELSRFPWGRGATGQPITPLLTVAVDSQVIPLGTSLYIPEFEGLPRDAAHTSVHDGCFLAQDRGLKVQGKHVDVFTGQRSVTQLWNGLVPSNSGVTIVVDSPQCQRSP